MIYYLAQEIETKPFIFFSSIANSDEELDDSEFARSPLVMAEKDVPAFKFGVCPLKIVDGELVKRTEAEMNQFEEEFEVSKKIVTQNDYLNEVRKSTFDFDGKSFPMNDAARTYYAVLRDLNVDIDVMAIDGTLYSLNSSKITAFYLALNTQLKALLSPKV